MDKLVVKNLSEEDLLTRVEWFSQPSIYGQMSVPYPVCLEETREWFQKTRSNKGRRDFVFFRDENRGVVGSRVAMGGLTPIDFVDMHAEIYLLVNPSMLGRGLGSRVFVWLCNFLFEVLNLNKAVLSTTEQNKGARALYERYGFIHEGTLRKHIMHQGRLVDRWIHGLLREEWERQPWRKEDQMIVSNFDDERISDR